MSYRSESDENIRPIKAKIITIGRKCGIVKIPNAKRKSPPTNISITFLLNKGF